MLAIASKNKYNREKGGDTMANTSAVYARIDTNLKDNAESILSQLGIYARQAGACGHIAQVDEIGRASCRERV